MKKVTFLLILIFIVAAILRLYRTADLLGFWYDQGRDALVAWQMWKHADFTLIGPTTGIEGIFLGPFYYYLITPLYIIGQGNPLVPAAGLVLINLGAMYLLYRFAKAHFDTTTGLLTVFLMAISFHLTSSHRWLSNPTPLPLFSVLAVWSLVNITRGRTHLLNWIFLGLGTGLGLQLEAASAVFFIPAVLITLTWFRKSVHWSVAGVSGAMGMFVLTLVPQILFDFRNHHILYSAFRRFLLAEKSFIPDWGGLLFSRLNFFFMSITEKFTLYFPLQILFALCLLAMSLKLNKRLLSPVFMVVLIWILTPLVGLIFYSGNKGYVWSYYLTGIYPFIFLAVGRIFSIFIKKNSSSTVLVLVVLGFLTIDNGINFWRQFSTPTPDYITFSQSLAAVDWAYLDSGGQPFNYDVYVPPILYAAYDYLFLWRGTNFYQRLPEEKLVTRLYTLFEPDKDHQVLLNTWMTRQASIGSIEETKYFGNVGVQRRHRFSTDEHK